MSTEPFNYYGCIRHPCPKPRAKNSGFCIKHKREHAKSKYPALLQALIKASGK